MIERDENFRHTEDLEMYTHKAGRVQEETIYEYSYKLKMGKDFLGPNLYEQGCLFLHCQHYL